MPATESTWRNQKLLHVIFGISSLLMLLTSIWMFANDHRRQWKDYQRKFRDVEVNLTDWQLYAEKTRLANSNFDQLSRELQMARATAPDHEAYQEFRRLVLEDSERRGESPPDFQAWDQTWQELEKATDRIHQQTRDLDEARGQVEALRKKRATGDHSAEAPPNAPEPAGSGDELARAEAHVGSLQQELESLLRQAGALRKQFLDGSLRQKGLRSFLDRARFREDQALSQRKFKAAEFDAARAQLDILVRDNAPVPERDAAQRRVDDIKGQLDALSLSRERDTAARQKLEASFRILEGDENQLAKKLADAETELERLRNTKAEREDRLVKSNFLPGKGLLELPIMDAFNSPLKIDNLWTEGLTLVNGSFGKVRRFDRCTTCHKGIAKTAAGSGDIPAYPQRAILHFRLDPPEEPPAGENDKKMSLESVFGFRLAERGLLDPNDVTIAVVDPGGRAALARRIAPPDASSGGEENSSAEQSDPSEGLLPGDVLRRVNDDRVKTLDDVRLMMLGTGVTDQPLRLTVERGLPQPYCSHPRLDLFVGSLSPHPITIMGCTSCHEGQGSATSFEFASHTPDSLRQAEDWAREYGWFNNTHWIFPMYPRRFMESTCLRCHHEVVELEPSERFRDPPAPRLVEGYHLLTDYGCYGCHEIDGFAGPNRRIGPDIRLEPNYSAAAAAVRGDPAFPTLDPQLQRDVQLVVDQPFQREARDRVRHFLTQQSFASESPLSALSLKMADVLEDLESPGRERKVGPSLRFVASKLDTAFLYDWIRDPTHFRPSTRMPRFFGLWKHLEAEPASLDRAKRNEPIEIRGMVAYLEAKSQPFEYVGGDAALEPASAERGKLAFELRGCLACHQHSEFPAGKATQGPDLSRLGDKFTGGADSANARKWLYSWLKQPTHYSPRTRMPNLFLDPVKDAEGKTTDPAADVVEFLLGQSDGWKPSAETTSALAPDPQALDELVLDYLRGAYSEDEARDIVHQGIPETATIDPTSAEFLLVGTASNDAKLTYVGQKTIAKYGCYGCHDIPGFEAAKPIGTSLADWGRKESTKIAFEHINEYLGIGHHGGGSSANGHHAPKAPDFYGKPDPRRADEDFFRLQLQWQDRSGFLWQKLREPRSFDFMKTENKGYQERLRMPLFPLDEAQREAVITFVLGLVSEPPAENFVYHPNSRNRAIQQGLVVLDRFNCGGCHILDTEKWSLEFEAETFGEPPEIADFPFVIPSVPDDVLRTSETPDPHSGRFRATIHGLTAIDNATGKPEVWDEEGDPLEEGESYDPNTFIYPLDLWQNAAVEGKVFQVGVANLEVPAATIQNRWGAVGGDLTFLLLPRVTEVELAANPSANAKEAWGWLPPPLVGEGSKVQPQWLHSFLMDPFPIRPAVFLRMPKFNMSPTDAQRLVDYFAAKDDHLSPYEYDARTSLAHVEASQAEFAQQHGSDASRLDHAMRIVTDTNYCIKCHSVGDFEPEGADRAKAPNLAMAETRLRPEFVRRWIANPKRILPYSNMPVNIPFDATADHLGGVSQELFPGTSIEQLDGVVDLLMNFGYFTGVKSRIGDLVKSAEAAAKSQSTGEDSQGSDTNRGLD